MPIYYKPSSELTREALEKISAQLERQNKILEKIEKTLSGESKLKK